MNKKDKKILFYQDSQDIEVLKSQGIKISRTEIFKAGQRFIKENTEVLAEARKEKIVLNMKRFFERKGWRFPPKKHPIVSVVHLINEYYGKEVCKHVPKDELEKKLNI